MCKRFTDSTANVVMICNDCSTKKEIIRESFLTIKAHTRTLDLLSDRITALENKDSLLTLATDLEVQASVSQQVKVNSDMIKQLTNKQEIKERQSNIIIQGMDASMGNGLREVIFKIFEYLGYSLTTWTATRIGSTNLVKVYFKSQDEASFLIKNAKRLRSQESYANIYINPDLTLEQRKINKSLRDKLKIVKKNVPGAFIFRGDIVTKDRKGVIHAVASPVSSNAANTHVDTPCSSKNIQDKRRHGSSLNK